MRMRLALGVIVRLFLPLINGMAKRWQGFRSIKVLRLPRNYHANRSLFTNLFAHAANTLSLSLSSVQGGCNIRFLSAHFAYHVILFSPIAVAHRIDPWLKKIKFRRPAGERKYGHLPLLPPPPHIEDAPDKSVTLNVLYEPPKTVPIRADVIFIHGLHGSLVNTWKQGMWSSEGRREKFERPPRPPVRPPKRPRHSRRLDAPHQFKRPRHIPLPPKTGTCKSAADTESNCPGVDRPLNTYTREEWRPVDRDMTYYCDEPETSQTIDELEYSFTTFRTMLPEEMTGDQSWMNVEERSGKRKNADYSACWPKDWLSKRFPDLRVIALNYTTDKYLWRPLWIKKRNRTSLAERAREMTDMLIANRVGEKHPIVWVGHSKGGIFIKQIIVDGNIALPLKVFAPFMRPVSVFYSLGERTAGRQTIVAILTRDIFLFRTPSRFPVGRF